MSTDFQHYAVDRIEGAHAVLVDDDGTTVDVELNRLPGEIGPGLVLRVSVDGRGSPVWEGAVVDDEETDARTSRAEETLKELRTRDPGGDIEL